MNREELNVKAHDLCERSRELRSHHTLRTDLQEECEELRTAIRKLRGACSQLPALPTTPGKGSLLSLLLRQRQLQAEVEVWRQQDEEKDVRSAARHGAGPIQAKMRLETSIEQLKMCLEVVKMDRDAAKRDLKREKKYLEETHMIQKALREKVAQAEEQQNKVKQSSKSSQQAWFEEQLEKHQSHSDTLKEELESFVEEHLTLEDARRGREETKSSKKQTTLKLSTAAATKHTTSLTQFIQVLVEQTLASPHQPYISTARLHPDYLLLLLRSGVIQCHPDKSSLVKMTPYHH